MSGRLDVALVERGLFASRSRAQAAVMAGQVRVEGQPATKPGATVAASATIEVDAPPSRVSRGGAKLDNALEALEVDVTGRTAIDVGASTGGFTEALLDAGAHAVIALDVGYGQLAWALRQDSRVHVLERTNARHLVVGDLPEVPDLATIDVSFISLRSVMPPVAACLGPDWDALLLVKPQFEVGRSRVGRGGVVRDPELRAQAARDVARAAEAIGAGVAGACDSGVPGPKGNRELFLHVSPLEPVDPERADALIVDAVV